MMAKIQNVSIPEIAVFAATRGLVGVGAGLLLAGKFGRKKRKTVGWSMLLSGIASTIPIAIHLKHKGPAIN